MFERLSTNEVADRLYRDEYGGWSWEGAKAMAEWLEGCEDGDDHEMELDVVAIRCEFSEYESAEEAAKEYGWTPKDADTLLWLQARTTVIEFDGGVIVQEF